MKPRQAYLILVVLFSLLFIVLITVGSYLISIQSKQFGIAAFLFALAAALGQIGALAMYIRQLSRDKLIYLSKQNKELQ